jgi:hypothetical protein
MKLATDLAVVQRSEEFPQQTFRIKASAKAFEILSSNLYSNPIQAIVRELSTNAADAHVAAGTQATPFKVHLPSLLEPTFSIRDLGTGLSHEEVMTLYTTYFDSNRSDSNDFTGALGLGSKSPYSYTDNYLVTSFYHGESRAYSMFKDEEGLPSVSLLSALPTDEPDGLLIEMAVRAQDFNAFYVAAQAYQYFSPRPQISGYSLELPSDEVVYEGTGWRLYDRPWHWGNQSIAIMGNIGYPIVANADRILGIGLHIDFPIGSLDIAANRETLHYSKRTAAVIHEKAQLIRREAAKLAQESLDLIPTLWEASLMAKEERRRETCQHHLRSVVLGTPKWRGQEFWTSIELPTGSTRIFLQGKQTRASTCQYVNVTDASLFVLPHPDVSEGRLRRWVSAEGRELAVLPPSEEECKAFLERYGIPPQYVVKAEVLPDIKTTVVRGARAQKPQQKKTALGVYTPATSFTHSSAATKCWVPCKVGPTDEGFYVLTSHGSLVIPGKRATTSGDSTLHPSFLRDLLTLVAEALGWTMPTYAITPSVEKEFQRRHFKIRPLLPALREATILKANEIAYLSIVENWRALQRIPAFDGLLALGEYMEGAKNSLTELQTLIAQVKQYNRGPVYNLTGRMIQMGILCEKDLTPAVELPIEKTYERVGSDYPLLRYLVTQWNPEERYRGIADYVLGQDALRERERTSERWII